MTELITSTKSHLKKVVPNVKEINIRFERDHGKYLSKIHVHIPGRVIHAEKKAETLCEALSSSYQAVLKQVGRFKAKQLVKKKLRKEKTREIFNSIPPE